MSMWLADRCVFWLSIIRHRLDVGRITGKAGASTARVTADRCIEAEQIGHQREKQDHGEQRKHRQHAGNDVD